MNLAYQPLIEWNEPQLKTHKLIKNGITYIMLYGGSNAGKTFWVCEFFNQRALKYPGSKHIMTRNVFADVKKKVYLETLSKIVRPLIEAGLAQYNKQDGTLEYSNGSYIFSGGLQEHDLDRTLGPKYDSVFMNECSQNTYNAYELLDTRLSPTATDKDGNLISGIFIIDQNPTVVQHWSNQLFINGIDPKTQKPKKDFGKYGKVLYLPQDNVKNIGKEYIEKLKSLSPDMQRRFLLGQFGSYEGLVYTLKEEHIIDPFEIPKDWRRIRSIDFGFVHPFVCLWMAMASDDTVYVYREYVETGLTVRIHAGNIKKFTGKDENIEATIADHDAEDRATLKENGIKTIKAYKAVDARIDRITDLLSRGKFKVFRNCTHTIDEFYSYRWKQKTMKDREVQKDSDHCMDSAGYGTMYLLPIKSPVKAGIL